MTTDSNATLDSVVDEAATFAALSARNVMVAVCGEHFGLAYLEMTEPQLEALFMALCDAIFNGTLGIKLPGEAAQP